MIHQYRSNGYNIVMDINSGAVHIVDDVVYDVLPLLEEKKREEDILAVLSGKYSEEAVREALSECRELEEAGVLFTEDVYENAIENF